MKGKPNTIRIISSKDVIYSSLTVLNMIKNYQDDGFIISSFSENELENNKSELIIKFIKRGVK